jgi:CelD/BcsL family acetyltransferase involved in cellulose biosynthesis
VVRNRQHEAVLILPLQLAHSSMLRIPLRFLEPIGMLNDVNRPRLALGPRSAGAYECAFACVRALRDEWDVIRIDEKSLDDWELQQLRAFGCSERLAVRLAPSFLCPWLDLRQVWDSFLRQRGSKIRKNLRAAQKRLEARGRVRVQTYERADEIPLAMQHMLELHRFSWKAPKKIGLSQSAAHEQFYRELTHAMASRGQCRIHILYCNEQPIAGTIAFMDDDSYYSAEIAHDERFSVCSPGTLLEAAELSGLMNERRYVRYDFMGGALNNKSRWTDESHNTYRVLLMKPGLRTLATDTYYFRLKPLALRYFPFLRRESVSRELSAPVPAAVPGDDS